MTDLDLPRSSGPSACCTRQDGANPAVDPIAKEATNRSIDAAARRDWFAPRRPVHADATGRFAASLLTVFALASGCSRREQSAAAVAELAPLGASGVSGTVSFTPGDGDVHIAARIHGLSPGDHGFHIHEFGDCSALDGASAGEHFNPGSSEHGAPGASKHHAGDLGNLVGAGADKLVTLDRRVTGFTLEAGPRGIVGRSVIVHAAPDDYGTQPAGNSGARIACGIVHTVVSDPRSAKPEP